MAENTVPPVVSDTVASGKVQGVLTSVSLVVSAITSLGTLLISIASDHDSNVWLVGTASALTALCLGILFVVGRKTGTHQKKRFAVAAGFSLAILVAAWLFVFREPIAFSRAFAAFSSKPAVLVDESVAWTSVPSESTRERLRLAALIDQTVTEPHRTSVFASTPDMGQQTLLVVSGVTSAHRFSLTLESPLVGPEATTQGPKSSKLTSLHEVVRGLDKYEVFFANAFDAGPVRLSVSAPAAAMNDLFAAAYHLLTAVRSVRSGSDRELAKHHLDAFCNRALVVVPDPSVNLDWMLEGILFGGSYYMGQQDFAGALKFVRAARRLFPSEARLRAAEAYAELSVGGLEPAEQVLGEASAKKEFSRLTILRGILEKRKGDYWSAATMLERAAANERDPAVRFHLDMAVAALMATTFGSEKKRGEHIRLHAAQALSTSEDSFLARLLQAYGWALLGNTTKSRADFESVRRETQSTHDTEIWEYWRALGMIALGRTSDALRALVELESHQPVGAPVLGLLAELYGAPLYEGYSEKYLNSEELERAIAFASRATELDENEHRSNRMLGFYKAALASRADRLLRRDLQQAALKYFRRAILNGGADAMVYDEMRVLHRELAQTIESRECAQRATELSCRRDDDAGHCAVVEVQELLRSGDFKGAERRTNEILSWFNTGREASELYKNNVLIQIAVAWYEADRLDTAERMYEILTTYLERKSDFAGRVQLLGAVACNHGFLKVDRHQAEEAAHLFKQGLRDDASADCEAGLSIALLQLGDDSAALSMYRRAKGHDANYGNLDVLRTGYFWSNTACDLIERLAAMDG